LGRLTALNVRSQESMIITYDEQEEIEIAEGKIKVVPYWKWVL
jgi:predicted AAA+ superfamily ATPase